MIAAADVPFSHMMDNSSQHISNRVLIVLLLVALGGATYFPVLTQPFIEDDFHNIMLARDHGPVGQWFGAFDDEVNRVRMTTWVMTSFIESVFGLYPPAFYAFSILLHIINCLLVYMLGAWRLIGYRTSAWAAIFFAVYEGHQEAVMWYSACNELLLFVFGLLAFNCWLRFLEFGAKRWLWFAGAIGAFLFTLLSKESSVIIVPLMLLPLLSERAELRRYFYLLPFVVIAAIYTYFIIETRRSSFRFSDGSFDLGAPFWITWSRSMFSLFWFWGLLAVGVIFYFREHLKLLFWSLVWCGISFVPYMFLLYMTRVPSRQTYLASAGLALIVGAALAQLWTKVRTRQGTAAFAALVLVMCAANIGYLWTKKRGQYLERARPTEQLIEAAAKANGPVYVECFPRPQIVADSAVAVALNKPFGTLIWNTPANMIPENATRVCISGN